MRRRRGGAPAGPRRRPTSALPERGDRGRSTSSTGARTAATALIEPEVGRGMKILDILTSRGAGRAGAGRRRQDGGAARARRAPGARSTAGIDADRLVEVLWERERLGSTAIGDGIAIPHGKLPGLKGVIGAFGRHPAGVDFDSLDGSPTHLFFLLVAPEDSVGQHLKALARVSRLLKDRAFRDQPAGRRGSAPSSSASSAKRMRSSDRHGGESVSARPRGRRRQRSLGLRQEHRDPRPRGPRLLLHRQPAGRARAALPRALHQLARAHRPRRPRHRSARAPVLRRLPARRSTSCARAGHRVEVLFLDAGDDVLVRRFSETRRPHPLGGEGGPLAGIQRERARARSSCASAPTASSTPGADRPPAARRAAPPLPRRRARPTASPCCWSRSATSSACRPTSTWCSTRAFSPTRSSSTSCAPKTGCDPAVAEYVLRARRGADVPPPHRGAARLHPAALPPRGPELLHRSPSAAPAAATARWRWSSASRRTAPARGNRVQVQHRDMRR